MTRVKRKSISQFVLHCMTAGAQTRGYSGYGSVQLALHVLKKYDVREPSTSPVIYIYILSYSTVPTDRYPLPHHCASP